MGALIFDIETGPLPWEYLSQFYDPPAKLGPFDPSAVKCGNLGPEKAREKVEAARQKHADELAAEAAAHEQHRQDFISQAPLSAITGRVLAVGYRSTDKDGTPKVGINGHTDERVILLQFWLKISKAIAERRQVVGHNIFGFDLPFLYHRSIILDIPVPWNYLDKGRYWHPAFVDTMTRWSFGQYKTWTSLDRLSRAFGIGSKPDGVSGADFWRLWGGTAEDKQRADEYLRNDLDMTFKVALRMGIH